MKKGFTMIELVFVIVILGIIASISVPRLAATRADAEIATTLSNYNTIVKDVLSYYAVNGEFAANINMATNVPLKHWDSETRSADSIDGTLYVKGRRCLAFNQRRYASSGDGGMIPIASAIAKHSLEEGDEFLFIHKAADNNEKTCNQIADKLGLPHGTNYDGNFIKLD